MSAPVRQSPRLAEKATTAALIAEREAFKAALVARIREYTNTVMRNARAFADTQYSDDLAAARATMAAAYEHARLLPKRQRKTVRRPAVAEYKAACAQAAAVMNATMASARALTVTYANTLIDAHRM